MYTESPFTNIISFCIEIKVKTNIEILNLDINIKGVTVKILSLEKAVKYILPEIKVYLPR